MSFAKWQWEKVKESHEMKQADKASAQVQKEKSAQEIADVWLGDFQNFMKKNINDDWLQERLTWLYTSDWGMWIWSSNFTPEVVRGSKIHENRMEHYEDSEVRARINDWLKDLWFETTFRHEYKEIRMKIKSDSE